ncbi:hypothetical protein RRG08_046621 [Elysia crispata]|uniref:Uncharacterized protein n=1 Tax=Elysia crispata TaxID=231223 RepID=A0AAE1AP90_9GAST|nr:hypothetical protein RRG08_046621 [Elysia crispata]
MVIHTIFCRSAAYKRSACITHGYPNNLLFKPACSSYGYPQYLESRPAAGDAYARPLMCLFPTPSLGYKRSADGQQSSTSNPPSRNWKRRMETQ